MNQTTRNSTDGQPASLPAWLGYTQSSFLAFRCPKCDNPECAAEIYQINVVAADRILGWLSATKSGGVEFAPREGLAGVVADVRRSCGAHHSVYLGLNVFNDLCVEPAKDW